MLPPWPQGEGPAPKEWEGLFFNGDGRIYSLLLTNHNIKNHVVSMLHTHGTDLAEVLDSLLDVLFDDAVMLRDAHALACKHCRLERAGYT